MEDLQDEEHYFLTVSEVADCMQALDFNGDDLTDTVQQKLIVLPTGCLCFTKF